MIGILQNDYMGIHSIGGTFMQYIVHRLDVDTRYIFIHKLETRCST